jgi:AraC-like DNA-binding protein
MEHYAFMYVNTALIMCCVALAIVFIALPLPENEGLRKYRTSLRFLSAAYLTMASLKMVVMVYDIAMVNIISMEGLSIASLQATLITLTLITLINPQYITKKLIYNLLMPVPVFIIAYTVVVSKWGDIRITTFSELIKAVVHPAIIIRELFLLYYVYQLIYLTYIFHLQISRFKQNIDDYFADNYQLHLTGVMYSFYAALTVGIFALASCFMFTALSVLIFTIAYTLFYLAFGIYYIQYPRTFIKIEKAIYQTNSQDDESVKTAKRFNWIELKGKIIHEKYYLKAGVNIEEMALYLKIGRTTLSNFINSEEGMNFNQWINTLRVEHAKNLLIEYPTHNLSEIAEMVGYSESSNFSRQFKLITNESPSVWRQNCRS